MLCIYLSLLASFPADSHRSILNWKFCLLIRLQQHTANIVMSLVLNFEHTAVHRYNAYFSLMLQHFRRTTGAVVLRVTCILRWIFYLRRIFFFIIYIFDISRSLHFYIFIWYIQKYQRLTALYNNHCKYLMWLLWGLLTCRQYKISIFPHEIIYIYWRYKYL